MPDCAADGCDRSAVVKVIGEDGFDKAYRCRECCALELDTDGGQ